MTQSSNRFRSPGVQIKFFGAILLMLVMAPVCAAEKITMNILPFSEIGLDGSSLGSALSPQFGSLLTTSLSGQIVVDVTGEAFSESIALDSASRITLGTQTFGPGYLPSSKPANMAVQVVYPGNQMAYGALRNAVASLTSAPLPVDSSNNFTVGGSIAFPLGTLDLQGADGVDSISISPELITSSQKGEFWPFGVYFDMPFSFSVYVGLADVTLDFSGEIMAQPAVPEPPTFALACASTVMALAMRRLFQPRP